MSVSFFAEYSDGSRYQVVYDPSERKTYLRTTSDNKMDVPYQVNGASFVRFDFLYQPQPGLRGCDVGDNLNRLHANLALLTPPTRPAAPTIPQTPVQEDLRLHIEPDSDPFRALQQAGARATTEYRDSRQRARQEMLAQLNQPDAQRIQDGRQYAAEVLHARKPRGRGAAFVITKGE